MIPGRNILLPGIDREHPPCYGKNSSLTWGNAHIEKLNLTPCFDQIISKRQFARSLLFGMVFVAASIGGGLRLVSDNLYYVNFLSVKSLIAFIDVPFQLHHPNISDILNPYIAHIVVPLKNAITPIFA